MNVQKIYEYALQREEEGYRFFNSNAVNASHAAAAQVFSKLAEEELRHIAFIKNLINHEENAATGDSTELQGKGWFEERARKEFLDQTLIESMIPDVAVLRTAFLIERDLSEFYEKAAAKTEGRDQAALNQLARWERGHEAFFKELHDRIFEEYTQMPWGG
jgi:rubrerythrin